MESTVPAAKVERGVCVLCGEAAVDAGRCSHCGAAEAPGGFRVRRVIAAAAHSRVYLADAAGGGTVAVKELLYALVPSTDELDAFQREAALLRELDHPRIPRFVASFAEGRGVGTRLYLVQEFIEGTTLADTLKAHRFDEVDAKDVARQVLPILSYLHARRPQIIHRDVKPANVIRRADGELVLVDFGAARGLEHATTYRATFVGTFGYMPPEQYGGTVDASADVYAFGMSLVHLLTRREPWRLVEPGEKLDVTKHLHVSPALTAWLQKACAPKREDRFHDAGEALAALNDPPRVAPALTHEPVLSRLPLMVVLGAAALLATGYVAGHVLHPLATRAPPPPPPPVVTAAAPVAAPATKPLPKDFVLDGDFDFDTAASGHLVRASCPTASLEVLSVAVQVVKEKDDWSGGTKPVPYATLHLRATPLSPAAICQDYELRVSGEEYQPAQIVGIDGQRLPYGNPARLRTGGAEEQSFLVKVRLSTLTERFWLKVAEVEDAGARDTPNDAHHGVSFRVDLVNRIVHADQY